MFFLASNISYWSKFGDDPLRSGWGWIEAGRGEPSGTKNGHPWPKLRPKFGQIFGHHPGDPQHSVVWVDESIWSVGGRISAQK